MRVYIVYTDEPNYKGALYGIYTNFDVAVARARVVAKAPKIRVGEDCKEIVDQGFPVIFGMRHHGRTLLASVPLDEDISVIIE